MGLKSIIVKSKVLSFVVFRMLHLKNHKYKDLIERRISADLFDYKTIAQPLPNSYDEICPDNNCFGIGYCIRNYCGLKISHINAFVEHGYFFGQYVSDQETKSFAKVILTFGDIRKKHIESRINKKAVPIGPYIHYAPDYLSPEQYAQKKKELGRVLLVFFSHSGTGCSVEFDVDYIISKIESIRDDFDTVVISLFWSDIKEEITAKLEEMGYRVFSAGHRYDYQFLSRVKTMISLADVTMSNCISTHIAYCSYLKKPHWFVDQDIIAKAETKKAKDNIRIGTQITNDPVAIVERDEIASAFKLYSKELTDEQRLVCEKYFGFNYIRRPDELSEIIK